MRGPKQLLCGWVRYPVIPRDLCDEVRRMLLNDLS